MKAPKGNQIPWCTVRKNSSGKSQVETIYGLPISMEYELYEKQPKRGEVDEQLAYLIGTKFGARPLLIAIHRDDLSKLSKGATP